MICRKRAKGQSTAEYLVVLALVLAAVTVMQVFGQRMLSAKVRGGWDKFTLTENANTGNISQYEPYYQNENFNIDQSRIAHVDIEEGLQINRSGITEKTTRTGNTSVLGQGSMGDDNTWQ